MEEHKFDRATAIEILGMVLNPGSATKPLEMREDGLYVTEAFSDRALGVGSHPSRVNGYVFIDWTPSEDMDWPDAPNPLTAPALPIPFTAAELAAFMLDGAGWSVQEAIDRRIGYPLDADAVSHLAPRERKVKEALYAAYELAARAQMIVGAYDYDEHQQANALSRTVGSEELEANAREKVFESGISREEANMRRERAKATVMELAGRASHATLEAQTKWVAWRRHMVRALLGRQSAGGIVANNVSAVEPLQSAALKAVGVSRAALVRAHVHEWASIEGDLKNASVNGLAVAKAGPRGWNEAKALEWARARGKLQGSSYPVDLVTRATVNGSNLPIKRHKIRG